MIMTKYLSNNTLCTRNNYQCNKIQIYFLLKGLWGLIKSPFNVVPLIEEATP